MTKGANGRNQRTTACRCARDALSVASAGVFTESVLT
jgi:hypothetical protein